MNTAHWLQRLKNMLPQLNSVRYQSRKSTADCEAARVATSEAGEKKVIKNEQFLMRSDFAVLLRSLLFSHNGLFICVKVRANLQ